ncbi:MAG TPA: thioredoxin family protein [Alkalispirochaeta sp.]|nr:thioredoxin family protein [Alkalispirochaeta sp.]
MGKKKSTSGGRSSGSPLARERQREEQKMKARAQHRRRAIFTVAAVVLGVGAVAAVIAMTDGGGGDSHDLSSVGTGVPAVVQVHDITCPVCSELRANVESIEDEFDDSELLIRVADIATDEGLAFARRHTANRRVTLLFLDGQGNLVDERVGLRSPDELRDAFSEHSRR